VFAGRKTIHVEMFLLKLGDDHSEDGIIMIMKQRQQARKESISIVEGRELKVS